jgi:hypothetical protein
MIELKNDSLVVSFPDVHPDARLSVDFQRTLRIPDDGKDYPLPPGLGRFPLKHVDDFAESVPELWKKHGGVMFPMHSAEAMWLNFRSDAVPEHAGAYPFALKIATGKRSAVTGEAWRKDLHRTPRQDYVVVPLQPWLDGYCITKGVIRQFIAMAQGQGYTAEEQLTGKAEVGGLQLEIVPMKRDAFERHFPRIVREEMDEMDDMAFGGIECCMPASPAPMRAQSSRKRAKKVDMGLAPGGRMKQEIKEDPYDLDDWDLESSSRCFVHLCDAELWKLVTGQPAPTTPPTAKDYSQAGLPWFQHTETGKAVAGGKLLAGLKSVLGMGQEQGQSPLPENDSTATPVVIDTKTGQRVGDQVREGSF